MIRIYPDLLQSRTVLKHTPFNIHYTGRQVHFRQTATAGKNRLTDPLHPVRHRNPGHTHIVLKRTACDTADPFPANLRRNLWLRSASCIFCNFQGTVLQLCVFVVFPLIFLCSAAAMQCGVCQRLVAPFFTDLVPLSPGTVKVNSF